MKIELEITDGVQVQSRKFKDNVSISDALAKMEQMYDNDYMGLCYSLIVNGNIYAQLEH